jgi:alpha-tubulin suppressor-like RCC1 family protein
VRSDGSERCWGWNVNGQLGNGTNTDSNVPIAVSGITTGSTMAGAMGGATCTLLTGGTAFCWGVNTYGQLGNGTLLGSNLPTQVVNYP